VKRHRGGRFEIRFLARALAVAGTAVAVSVCGEQAPWGGTTGPVNVNDATGPVITVIARPASLYFGAGDTIRVLAKAVDPSGIAMLGARLFVLDTVTQRPVTKAGDSTAYTSRQVTRQDSFKVVVPASLAPGAYLLHVFAVDSSAALNDSTSEALAVTVRDVRPPTGSFVSPVPNTQVVAGDSVQVQFRAQDLTGVDSVTFRGYSLRGSASLGTLDTVLRFQKKTARFAPARTDTTVTRNLMAAADSTPETVYLEAVVWDVGGNRTPVIDSIQIVAGPLVRVSAPVAGVRHAVGTTLNVTVAGSDPHLLTYVGFVATGVEARADSVAVSPAATSATRMLAWAVPASAALGAETVTPFARNQVGLRFTGAPVVLSFADAVNPTVTIDTPAVALYPVASGDSVYVRVHVGDNRGVTQVVLTGTAHRGSVALGTDTTVTRFVSKTVSLAPAQDTVITRYLLPVLTNSTSETVIITATVRDSSGNTSSDTASIRIVGGPVMSVVRPSAGATTSVGKSIIIELRGVDANGVRLMGWRTTGVLVRQDSAFFSPVSGNLADTATFTDTLIIPALTPLGTFTVTAFGLDSLGDVSGTVSGVTVTVQSSAGDVAPPAVRFQVDRRVEIDDSVTVITTDAGGIRNVGFRVTTLDTTRVLRFDTLGANLDGTLSDVSRTFSLSLPDTLRYPSQVIVRGYGTDSTGNKGFSVVAETLTVVAGKTYSLPAGSQIADAIYNARRRELYLSNYTQDRIEVFSLASNSFVARIPVGSRPWGLALWPRATSASATDTLYGDTLIVANSGGTNLSIVDVRPTVRREVRRHQLPNYSVEKVKTVTNAAGGSNLEITVYDFSDRPQHVAAVCRAAGAAPCDSVIAVYSTTPTSGQSFPGQGYLAWENLSQTGTPSGKGHLFWEQANVQAAGSQDTIQIISTMYNGSGGTAFDTIIGAGAGMILDPGRLVFRDTTFVRNSGNFLRVLVGEGGGGLSLARVMAYDGARGRSTTRGVSAVIAGVTLSNVVQRDTGITAAGLVQDFIGNRASSVTAVAANFNGSTNLVRADSIYVFDNTLRQSGILQVSGAAHGMDVAPSHVFSANARGTNTIPGDGDADARIVFAARPDSSIDVFDTYFFGRVTDTATADVPIPIRNALVGAVRVTPDLGGTVLTGITNQGLVVVRLPTLTNPFMAPAIPIPTVTLPGTAPVRPTRRTRDPSPPNE